MADQIARRTRSIGEEIDYAERFVRLHNPKRQLGLGYSLTRKNGKIVRSAGAIITRDELETEFADGVVRSRAV